MSNRPTRPTQREVPMNSERVLEALRTVKYHRDAVGEGTSDAEDILVKAVRLAKALREMAWYIATGEVDRERESEVDRLAAAIMEVDP
jgi:ribonuclease HI